MNEGNTEKPSSKANVAFIIFFIIVITLIFLYYWLPHPLREQHPRVICASKLKQLNLALHIYAYDFSDTYPAPEKWCDSIVDIVKDLDIFRCLAVDEGKCHYAINPNCDPNSPADTVLLFETKGGWNQFGGPELMAIDNHTQRGCNIGFNDGHVEFIKEEEIGDLKWSDE